MTSVQGQKHSAYRNQAPKGPSGPASNRSDKEDHKDPLGSNKPRSSKAPTRPFKALTGPFKAPAGPPQASLIQDPGAKRYSQQDLDKIIQTFFYTSKRGFGDKLKVKTPDIYCSRSHMECYNFCQQYKNHFAICGTIESNRIPFAASFF